ncbi:NADPH:quinone reductase-like Zn-dependent oxidoreductase [Nocardioides sp. BE266]|uniref:quinone oxidoreductase family protein n=1 Tax=Nocardioides sp. BE266 TaxID=2817725 RepID=UPI00285C4478|nr:zinc-binding alcohol dehydrogenase family protein [Nocardioides sp. BE266]MDR7254765.1 NADPH:quinone reductase-like Zn-dependent oxidoreductase [Nocardioides sp. BE266]
MHAAVLRTHGAAPIYAEHPDPAPGDGVLVRMTATPVVPLDLLCASGTSYFGARTLPYVPGVQGVGEVVSGGDLDPGTRVFVSTSAGMADGDGAMAELCVVPEAGVVEVDLSVDDVALAALGLSGVAAWQALGWRAGLRPGESVVVLGAGGAVGQAAIGAARAQGAGRVVAVCRPGDSAVRAAAQGPDAVVEIADPDPAVLAEALLDVLPDRADVVVDPVFGWVAESAVRAMAPGGRLVNLGGSAADVATLSSAVLRGSSLSLLGYTNNALTVEQRAEALTAIAALAAEGRIGVAHEARPLSEVEEVWHVQQAGAGTRQVLVPAMMAP